MVTKVIIRDRKKSPLRYISELEIFRDGTEFNLKPGVNVIIGENGSGKTTLIDLIKAYLVVDYTECFRGEYNCNINDLFKTFNNNAILDGVDVYADYKKNTFRLSHAGEKVQNQALKSFDEFGSFAEQQHSSTGEGVIIALNYLFNYIFGKKAKLTFDYNQFKEVYPLYVDYVEKHRVECDDEWTILMDEPDRNLSLDNIKQIKEILSFHKPHTQLIVVLHNPLLIYTLSKNKSVNFIQLTDGYLDKVVQEIDNLVH